MNGNRQERKLLPIDMARAAYQREALQGLATRAGYGELSGFEPHRVGDFVDGVIAVAPNGDGSEHKLEFYFTQRGLQMTPAAVPARDEVDPATLDPDAFREWLRSQESDEAFAERAAQIREGAREEAEAEQQAQVTRDELAKEANRLRKAKIVQAIENLSDLDYGLNRKRLAQDFDITLGTLDDFRAKLKDRHEKQRSARAAAPLNTEMNAETVSDSSTSSRNLTERGNAERFVDEYGDIVRYNHTSKEWLIYDGKRFCRDERGKIGALVKDVLRRIYSEAQRGETAEDREAIAKWAIRSEQARVAEATMRLIMTEDKIAVSENDLDRDHWLLNVNNGTIDLRSGSLRPHDKSDLITLLAPVDYDPSATAPRWKRFVEEILPHGETRQYVQTLCGYCLTGDTSAQVFPVAQGSGQNGKSTLFNRLRDILGDYAGEISPAVLMASKWNDGGKSATPEIARTKGKRAIVAGESKEGSYLDESLIKPYTGGEKIVARFLHGNPFTFQPTAKIILFTNHKPQIPSTNKGIWRRVKLIPFNYTVPDDRKDEHLPDELREEWPGILNWFLEGLERYHEKGLVVPKEIVDATKEYQASEDVLSAFLEEHCTVIVNEKARSGALFERYRRWCAAANEKPFTQKRFKALLDERGYTNDHDDKGSFFLGLALRPEPLSDELDGLSQDADR